MRTHSRARTLNPPASTRTTDSTHSARSRTPNTASCCSPAPRRTDTARGTRFHTGCTTPCRSCRADCTDHTPRPRACCDSPPRAAGSTRAASTPNRSSPPLCLPTHSPPPPPPPPPSHTHVPSPPACDPRPSPHHSHSPPSDRSQSDDDASPQNATCRDAADASDLQARRTRRSNSRHHDHDLDLADSSASIGATHARRHCPRADATTNDSNDESIGSSPNPTNRSTHPRCLNPSLEAMSNHFLFLVPFLVPCLVLDLYHDSSVHYYTMHANHPYHSTPLLTHQHSNSHFHYYEYYLLFR